jgi:hypothetical protein
MNAGHTITTIVSVVRKHVAHVQKLAATWLLNKQHNAKQDDTSSCLAFYFAGCHASIESNRATISASKFC